MNKSELRKIMKQKKREMTQEEIKRQSNVLTELFLASEEYRKSNALYIYLSYNQEVRTENIIKKAWIDGKIVAVPKVFGNSMEFIEIIETSLIAPGAYNIPEPVENGPVSDIEGALILMPGLAFDSFGHRCGYGGGFYDIYLERHPGHPTVALCYDFQMVDLVVTDERDFNVDRVISGI